LSWKPRTANCGRSARCRLKLRSRQMMSLFAQISLFFCKNSRPPQHFIHREPEERMQEGAVMVTAVAPARWHERIQRRHAQPGILVVDDEDSVRRLLQIVLERQGFSVWSAADGRTAIRLYRQYRTTISLVLLDVRMPELDGPQTLAELREFNPAIRCCFM